MDGHLFNLRRLQVQTRTQERLIWDHHLTDDAAVVAQTEQALLRITSCITNASSLFRLDVSLRKTEVLHQLILREEHRPPHVTIDDGELKSTQQFTYQGCIISSDARIDKEIDDRLSSANSSFGRLNKRVWSNKSLKNKTKIRVYRAVVLTTLIYGSETSVTYGNHIYLLIRMEVASSRPDYLPTLSAAKTFKLSLLVKHHIMAIDEAS